MNNTYFKLDDDFEKIIRENLKDKKINKINFIPTGWTNIVYEVETDFGDYFFRFPRDDFWARTIVKDYEFGKYIHQKTDFDTIKLQISYDNGRPFSIHKKIPGTPLAEKMNNLTEKEVKDISDDIGKFMSQLHNIKYNDNDIFTIDNIGVNLDEFLDELLKLHLSKKDMGFWSIKENNISKKCLVHGDLNSSNILLDDENHVRAIIDFGFGGYGKPNDDVARIIGRCPETFKDEIIKSYEKYSNTKINIEELNDEIQTWSNIDQGYINYMRTIGIYE